VVRVLVFVRVSIDWGKVAHVIILLWFGVERLGHYRLFRLFKGLGLYTRLC